MSKTSSIFLTNRQINRCLTLPTVIIDWVSVDLLDWGFTTNKPSCFDLLVKVKIDNCDLCNDGHTSHVVGCIISYLNATATVDNVINEVRKQLKLDLLPFATTIAQDIERIEKELSTQSVEKGRFRSL